METLMSSLPLRLLVFKSSNSVDKIAVVNFREKKATDLFPEHLFLYGKSN